MYHKTIPYSAANDYNITRGQDGLVIVETMSLQNVTVPIYLMSQLQNLTKQFDCSSIIKQLINYNALLLLSLVKWAPVTSMRVNKQ